MSAFPLREQDGPIDGMLTVGFEAVAAVASLIPLCANCHSIRDEHGQWHGLEQFVENRTRSHFTHGLCPSCVREFEEGRPPRPSRTPR